MEKREAAENSFKNLMNGIEISLSIKNRDKYFLNLFKMINLILLIFVNIRRFTQNIATFRRDLNECFKSNSTSTSVINHQFSQQKAKMPQTLQQKLLAV